MLVASNNILAIDTVGYVVIQQIKVWSGTIDIYLEDDQEHQCPGSLKTRYLVDVTKNQHVSFALASFMAGKTISLSYSCNENGHPWVEGIRVR